ncbi:MAG: hypothetical protein ACI88A_000778 [Paraglaciecola sp.]|jgi:hypothetical protein
MALLKIPLNTAYLSLYLEAEQGMVFHHIKQSLYQLPPLSIAFLLALDEGLDKPRALAEIAQSSQIPPEQLSDTYQQIKSLFNQDHDELCYLDGRYPELAKPLSGIKTAVKKKTLTYQVADATFAILTGSAPLYRDIETLLAPCQKNLEEVDFEITINPQQEVYSIYCNELLVEEQLTYPEIIPLIIDRLQILAFQKSDYYFCFHGAALQTPHGDLLLPGKSGDGKSTLSATLANEENGLYSDEIIALNKHLQLCILTLPIGLKSGSWDILATQYPQLADEPVWHRLDGRLLKYVWPSAFAKRCHQKNDKHRDFLLVNPNFRAAKDTGAAVLPASLPQKLSVIDTISMLTQSGYQLGVELSEEKLQQLIDFISASKCYQLSYANTDQAIQQLKLLWQK